MKIDRRSDGDKQVDLDGKTARIDCSKLKCRNFITHIDEENFKTKASPKSLSEDMGSSTIMDEDGKREELNTTDDIMPELYKDFLKNKIVSDYIKRQFRIISTLRPTINDELKNMSVKIPQPRKKVTNKTLIVDLDNTLVYAMSPKMFSIKRISDEIDVRSVSYVDSSKKTLVELKVLIRKYALDMLKELSEFYEIIVFTGANKEYADAIINEIDPANTLIDYRIYRDSCIRINNSYIKDLRILNRDKYSTIILDDSIASFSNQFENGI